MSLRLATLAAALAVASLAAAQGQGLRVPQAAPSDFTGATTIDAESIEGVGDLEITARGNAEIRRDDLSIFGQRLRINREFNRIGGEGGVGLRIGADRFFGPRLQYDTSNDTGAFDSPGYLLQRENTARGKAERIEFLGRMRYKLFGGTFTTCEPGKEDWRLEADELDLDYESEEGRARHPRLRFFDTTILAAPYLSFPLESRRKTGFLTPYYSQNSRRGFEVGIPYYINIMPELDTTITPVTMAKRGYQIKDQTRYMGGSYTGELRLEYLPDDEQLHRSRSGVSWQHTQSFGKNLSGAVDFNRVSDDAYFVDLASQVRQVSQRTLPRDAWLLYGGGGIGSSGSTLQARVQRFQTLQDPNAPIVPPYDRLPQFTYTSGKTELGSLDGGLGAEFVRFHHESLVEGTRASANPTLALPVLGPGWFVTPKAGVRAVTYSLERTDFGAPTSPNMALPWFSLDQGLIFEREARFFSQAMTQTLEPRLFYLFVPFRNQDAMPIFDTALADFNYPQLFNENRFSGGDRFGDANQLTAAITSRFLETNGQERMRVAIGQRYYFEQERVGLTPTSTLRTANTSDIIASLGGRFSRALTGDTTVQYTGREGDVQRFSIGGRYAPEIAKVLNASYRFQRDTPPLLPMRQVDISGQWPVAQGWYGVGRYNYSLLDKRLLEGLAGFEYNAGCWVFRVVAQRIQAAAQVSSSALIFQLEFTGLGQVGTDQASEFLKRNVPGYSATNSRDPTLAPPSLRQQLPFEQVY
jgi:LPS-assembly protein